MSYNILALTFIKMHNNIIKLCDVITRDNELALNIIQIRYNIKKIHDVIIHGNDNEIVSLNIV